MEPKFEFTKCRNLIMYSHNEPDLNTDQELLGILKQVGLVQHLVGTRSAGPRPGLENGLSSGNCGPRFVRDHCGLSAP